MIDRLRSLRDQIDDTLALLERLGEAGLLGEVANCNSELEFAPAESPAQERGEPENATSECAFPPAPAQKGKPSGGRTTEQRREAGKLGLARRRARLQAEANSGTPPEATLPSRNGADPDGTGWARRETTFAGRDEDPETTALLALPEP